MGGNQYSRSQLTGISLGMVLNPLCDVGSRTPVGRPPVTADDGLRALTCLLDPDIERRVPKFGPGEEPGDGSIDQCRAPPGRAECGDDQHAQGVQDIDAAPGQGHRARMAAVGEHTLDELTDAENPKGHDGDSVPGAT